jgi:hypothetical protein
LEAFDGVLLGAVHPPGQTGSTRVNRFMLTIIPHGPSKPDMQFRGKSAQPRHDLGHAAARGSKNSVALLNRASSSRLTYFCFTS